MIEMHQKPQNCKKRLAKQYIKLMGHSHLTPFTVFLAETGMRDSLRIRSVVEAANASKRRREVEIEMHGKCGGNCGAFMC